MSLNFKNANGRVYLQGLFYETTLADKSSVVYTLKNHDHEGYPSLYRLYMETGDLTEYQFAVQHLAGWDHWVELSGKEWFKPYVEAWRDELRTKILSEAHAAIREVSRDKANPGRFQANKYLVESILSPVEAKKRGRPSKGSRDTSETLQRALEREIHEDAKRLGIQ